MKKFLLIITGLFAACLMASAQIMPQYSQPAEAKTISVDDFEYISLLQAQNKLLKSRHTALTVTVVGTAVTEVGALFLQDSEENVDRTAATAVLLGSLTASVGLIWSVVNEFSLINNQRKINDKLILRAGAGGLALQF